MTRVGINLEFSIAFSELRKELEESLDERDKLAAQLAEISKVIGRHSCECDGCDHDDYDEEHDDDCERCLHCVLRDVLEKKS